MAKTDIPPSVDEHPAVDAVPRISARLFLRRHALTTGTVVIAILMWTIFVTAAPDVFLSSSIYNAFATTTPLWGMMALALTFVVITREMDLSFVSVMALGMVGFTRVFDWTGNVFLAILACLIVGLACGCFNGFLVAILGIPSLVITLGTMFFFRGIEMVLLDGSGVALTGDEFTGLRNALNGQTAGIPNEMVWMVVIGVVLWLVLNRTRFGAHLFVVGDNADSARMMGVRVARVKIAAFGTLGVVAAFSGLVASMQSSYLWPTLGEGSLLLPIAAVFLGGTSVFGGIGTVFGSFLGALMVGSIQAGVISAGMDGFYTQLFFGMVIIISLVLQTLISRRMRH
ncbi:ABC transporter permease [Actinobacteria bacterium YIM 96077]|uniref:ABC transporter permease n=1 Tax=Phytoactinopolyspora halophila TaxID=1981511 RepID=A0A329QHK2_9ACTN|nr:ABC transporter permease [Phytoactinopolyspora halophila]AYY13655.1 ABC transporter permease [Actinobacteria bacterium YIM 96077]RAW11219.1 ABC transporter permease [Phytoactinopolyspora halophila]